MPFRPLSFGESPAKSGILLASPLDRLTGGPMSLTTRGADLRWVFVPGLARAVAHLPGGGGVEGWGVGGGVGWGGWGVRGKWGVGGVGGGGGGVWGLGGGGWGGGGCGGGVPRPLVGACVDF